MEQEALVRNPFCSALDITDIPDEIQDEFLDLRSQTEERLSCPGSHKGEVGDSVLVSYVGYQSYS